MPAKIREQSSPGLQPRWTAQQLRKTFPWDTASGFLLRELLSDLWIRVRAATDGLWASRQFNPRLPHLGNVLMWNESSASRETWIEFALDCHRVGRQSETGGRNTDWPIRLILVEHEPVGWTRFMQQVVERFVLKPFPCGIDGVFTAHLLVYRTLSVKHD